jgi:hypothetical protein
MKYVFIVFVQEQQSFDSTVSYVGFEPDEVDWLTRYQTNALLGRKARVFSTEKGALAYRDRLGRAIKRFGQDDRELSVVVSKCRMMVRE